MENFEVYIIFMFHEIFWFSVNYFKNMKTITNLQATQKALSGMWPMGPTLLADSCKRGCVLWIGDEIAWSQSRVWLSASLWKPWKKMVPSRCFLLDKRDSRTLGSHSALTNQRGGDWISRCRSQKNGGCGLGNSESCLKTCKSVICKR